jgi:hypothetical protein
MPLPSAAFDGNLVLYAHTVNQGEVLMPQPLSDAARRLDTRTAPVLSVSRALVRMRRAAGLPLFTSEYARALGVAQQKNQCRPGLSIAGAHFEKRTVTVLCVTWCCP